MPLQDEECSDKDDGSERMIVTMLVMITSMAMMTSIMPMAVLAMTMMMMVMMMMMTFELPAYLAEGAQNVDSPHRGHDEGFHSGSAICDVWSGLNRRGWQIGRRQSELQAKGVCHQRVAQCMLHQGRALQHCTATCRRW